jgi:hypothetical protein
MQAVLEKLQNKVLDLVVCEKLCDQSAHAGFSVPWTCVCATVTENTCSIFYDRCSRDRGFLKPPLTCDKHAGSRQDEKQLIILFWTLVAIFRLTRRNKLQTMPPLNRDSNDHFQLFHTESQTSVAKRKKSVRFAPQSLQYGILGLLDFTTQETTDSWYTRNEFLGFTADINRTIRLLENKNSSSQINDIEYTARGSICRTQPASRRRKQIRCGARDLVLRAQLHPNSNDEWIAKNYIHFSRPSAQEALEQAMTDHRDANHIHTESIRHFWDNFFNDDWIRLGLVSPEKNKSNKSEPSVDNSDFDETWLCGAVATI